MIIALSDLPKIVFPLIPWDRVFLYGVPWAGKTAFTQELIKSHFAQPHLIVTSPTYNYYQKYGHDLYHFDLYRAETLANIQRIGADEIFDDPDTICLIEWPELLENILTPTHRVSISVEKDLRNFIIDVVKR